MHQLGLGYRISPPVNSSSWPGAGKNYLKCYSSYLQARAHGLPPPSQIKKMAYQILQAQCHYGALPYSFELSILLSNVIYMRQLNQTYRQLDQSTDVLSFPLIHFPNGAGAKAKVFQKILAPIKTLHEPPIALGDVVISYNDCLKQVRQRQAYTPDGKLANMRQLFAMLLIHGILHLFGYDHETNAHDARRMQAQERKLYTFLALA